MSIHRCPKCNCIITENASSCSCGWVAAIKPENGQCMASDCTNKFQHRFRNKWYCPDHYYRIRKHMKLLTPIEKRMEEMIEEQQPRARAGKS